MFFRLLLLIATAASLFISASAQNVRLLPSSGDATTVYAVKVKLTGYDSCGICCEGWSKHKKTSQGVNALKTTGVAAAPSLIPAWSKVFIPGLKLNPNRVVDDTGGGMRQYAKKGKIQFDVRFRTHAEALSFGKRYQLVYVVLQNPSFEQETYFRRVSEYVFESESSDPEVAISEAQLSFADAGPQIARLLP